MNMKLYEVIGDVAQVDSVIGLSFGTSTGPASANRRLADFALGCADGRPLIADRTLVDAMPDGHVPVDHVVEGPVTDGRIHGVGTWGTLAEARTHMEERPLRLPVVVAQAHHGRRVVLQARRVGLADVVVSEGLPADFDPDSQQIWTRSPAFWVPANTLGSLVLRWRGQL